jgi:hypothetical protein
MWRPRIKSVRKDTFKFEEGLSMYERAAAYLWFYAQKEPEMFVPYNELLKRVMGYRRVPAIGTREVDLFRAKGQGIRAALIRMHKCSMVTAPGYGWRATIGSEDISLHVIPKQLSRASGMLRTAHNTMEIIDARKLSPARRAWYEKNVGKLSLMTKQLEEARKSLPALVAATDEIEKKKK